MNKRQSVSVTMTLLLAASLQAGTATITIDAGQKGPAINPRMYGIFLEEINHGVDGGLYAELIRVAPAETRVNTVAEEFGYEFPPRSLTILRIKTK